MKLLMFQARHFEFAPQTPDPPPVPNRIDAVTVVFIHAEAHDVCNQARLARKAARHVKWLCNKRGLTNIALHSFAHLSESKAPVEFGEWFIQVLGERLRHNGYHVVTTPYGLSCGWELSVFPEPIAKVYKTL